MQVQDKPSDPMPQLAYQLVVKKEAEHDDALSIHRDMNPLSLSTVYASHCCYAELHGHRHHDAER